MHPHGCDENDVKCQVRGCLCPGCHTVRAVWTTTFDAPVAEEKDFCFHHAEMLLYYTRAHFHEWDVEFD